MIDKAEVQNLKKFVRLSVKSTYKIGFSRIPPKTRSETVRFRRKRYVSLHIFGKNVTFHSAYLLKTHNFASSLNTLYTAESAQFYSAFFANNNWFSFALSPNMRSLPPLFCRKRSIRSETHSYEDNAKFNSAFSATTLSHASRFLRKSGVIENFEYLGKFLEYFQKCWLYCVF
jgi:hypothetical protein